MPFLSQLPSFTNTTKTTIASDFLRIYPLMLILSHLVQSQIYKPSTTHTSQQLRHIHLHRPSPSHILQCITSAGLLRVAQGPWTHNPAFPWQTLILHYADPCQSVLELPWITLSAILVEHLRVALPVDQRTCLDTIHTSAWWTQTCQIMMGMTCLM